MYEINPFAHPIIGANWNYFKSRIIYLLIDETEASTKSLIILILLWSFASQLELKSGLCARLAACRASGRARAGAAGSLVGADKDSHDKGHVHDTHPANKF